MKKNIKRVFAILVASVVFTVSVLAVTSYAYKDQILNSDIGVIDQIPSGEGIENNDITIAPFADKHAIGQTVLFTHTIEKGENLEIPLSYGSYKIADNTYLVDIVLNNDHENANYRIKNAELVMNLDKKANILTAYCSDEGSNYTLPNVSYADEQKRVRCFSENGYIHFQMLLSGVQSESLSFDLKYAVAGDGLYSFNNFSQTWEGLELKLK